MLKKADLVAVFQNACKSRKRFAIGIEHEQFVFQPNMTRAAYAGKSGIKELLVFFKQFGYKDVRERGKLIGLFNPNTRQSISLEPGGQFELAGAPLKTIEEVRLEITQHFERLDMASKELNISFLAAGFDPYNTRESMHWMPKGRYAIMSRYMETVGSMGLDMMTRTCTVQVNLDYSSEADMARKMRVGMALQPLVAAYFAKSTMVEGKDSGYKQYRTLVWQNTDPARSGILPFVFDDDFGFERYVDYLLEVPMYFVKRDGQYYDMAGHSFYDFMNGILPGFEGDFATLSDFDDHISVAFPEVRLKRFIELRGADSGDVDHIMAVTSFWVNLFYNKAALDAAFELIKNWTYEDVLDVYIHVPKEGTEAIICGKPIKDWMQILLEIAVPV
ncbi:MAG: glutamate-cysteine ligase family protein [Candidatus Paracaedibacteraceae bacterium]|nr:glutamate-cysteine ligase family protein [Candidatus Paracaedibacteraceae bacterium]